MSRCPYKMVGKSDTGALATAPASRGCDLRKWRLLFSSSQIQSAGRLISRDPNDQGSILDHVRKPSGDHDPWVSTTSVRTLARGGAQSPDKVYVYYIDPKGLTVVDTVKTFEKAGQEHPHPHEREFSVKGSILWQHITKWKTFQRSKKVGTMTRY